MINENPLLVYTALVVVINIWTKVVVIFPIPVIKTVYGVNDIDGTIVNAVVKFILYTPALDLEIIKPEPCVIVELALTLPLIILNPKSPVVHLTEFVST